MKLKDFIKEGTPSTLQTKMHNKLLAVKDDIYRQIDDLIGCISDSHFIQICDFIDIKPADINNTLIKKLKDLHSEFDELTYDIEEKILSK